MVLNQYRWQGVPVMLGRRGFITVLAKATKQTEVKRKGTKSNYNEMGPVIGGSGTAQPFNDLSNPALKPLKRLMLYSSALGGA
jgi:hypothetical protein